MHDERAFGSQVRQTPPPRGSRRARRWPRLLVFSFLTVLSLLAIGGTARASELDPNETATDALDPIVGTVTGTVDPVVEAATDTVDPVVGNVTDSVDPVVGTVTDTLDPVIGTVTDTIDPVVDTVVPPTKGIVGTGGSDPLEPLPWLPAPGGSVPDPTSPGGVTVGSGQGRMTPDRNPGATAELPWSPSSTTIAQASGIAGVHRADTTPGRGAGGPTLPMGGGGQSSSMTLLVLLAALTTALRAWRPPILSSIVPRAVPMRGTALALSVERPG
jgi:hypothetical protein